MSSKFSKSATEGPCAVGFMPYERYNDINKARYPSHVVGDNRMTFDFSLTPRLADVEDYKLFTRYCQTGKHPSLRRPNYKRESKQTRITDYFPALTESERELHASAETCTCPMERDVIANKIHDKFLERRNKRSSKPEGSREGV
jgi:hypothetical protein